MAKSFFPSMTVHSYGFKLVKNLITLYVYAYIQGILTIEFVTEIQLVKNQKIKLHQNCDLNTIVVDFQPVTFPL